MAQTRKTPTKRKLRSQRQRERPVLNSHPRSILAELIKAGYTPDLSVPGSYTPTKGLDSSNLPSNLSNLSELDTESPSTSSPHSNEAEQGSKNEVELIVSFPDLGAMTSRITRSQSRALQAHSTSAPARSSSPQPTSSPPDNLSTDSSDLLVPSSPTLSTPPFSSPTQTPPILDPPTPLAPALVFIPPPVAPQPALLIPPVQQQAPPLVPPFIQPPLPAAQPRRRMPLTDLPGCGECSTPTFDDTCSEELPRFFDDLELLLGRHNVVDEQEHKQAALCYLSFQTETLWKTAESWADQTKSYQEFWEEIFKLYLGSLGDWTYTMQDLDLLLGHYARVGILMSADLGEYHRKFLLITRYLISKGHLSTLEQHRFFL